MQSTDFIPYLPGKAGRKDCKMARTLGWHEYKGYRIIKGRYGVYRVYKNNNLVEFGNTDVDNRFSFFRDAKAAIDEKENAKQPEVKNEAKSTRKYMLSGGYTITSNLSSADEIMKRRRRLSTLCVITEQNDCKEGQSICKKALRAYNKIENFTGIVRLTPVEKDWLSYKLESDFLSNEGREVVKFYIS